MANNNVTKITNNYYACETRRRDGDNVLLFIPDLKYTDNVVDDDKFYRNYEEFMDDLSQLKVKYNYVVSLGMSIVQQILSESNPANIHVYIENTDYDAYRVELPFNVSADYKKYICDKIFNTIKNTVESANE